MAHLGVRTATHKLIHYWKKDAYELFDLTADPASSATCSIDGPWDAYQATGTKSVSEAIQVTVHQ
jgi:hypothetical protein